MRLLLVTGFLWMILPGILPAQSSFVVPILVSNPNATGISGGVKSIVLLGVNPSSTVGMDNDTLDAPFWEAPQPPKPPSYPLLARFYTIPGRVSTLPTGLGSTGSVRDFRPYVSETQIDSFLVEISGDAVAENNSLVSWPAHLDIYASSWSIKSLGSSVVPPTDMLASSSVEIVQDGFTSSYRLLIVKSGAKPSEAPASFYSVKVDSAQPNGDPIPFRDFSQTYAPWNTGMSLKLDTVNGKGYILVERFGSSPADLSFSGTAPRHVSRYRWTIDPFGITSIQGNTWLEIENQVFANGITDPHTVTIYWRPTIGAGPFTALPTSYQFVAPTSKTAPESTLVSAGTHFGEYVLGSDENGLLTDVSHRTPASPALFSLAQNYPNPFNPTTVIQFSLPRSSDVRIDVFNVVGQKVRSLFAAQAPGGLTTLQFDGRDTQGRNLPSGVYIYRMTAGQFLQAKKMLLVR